MVEGVGFLIRGTLAAGFISSALGYGGHAAWEMAKFEPDAKVVRESGNLQSAADDLQITSTNPVFVKSEVDSALTKIGDLGYLDDRLEAVSTSLDNRGLDSGVTESELTEIGRIKRILTNLTQEKSQTDNPWSAQTGVAFVVAVDLILLWSAMELAFIASEEAAFDY